jgi:hypothetical protein
MGTGYDVTPGGLHIAGKLAPGAFLFLVVATLLKTMAALFMLVWMLPLPSTSTKTRNGD